MSRCAIYVRVSSAGQEDNYSLPTQEAACRAFAAERGWEVTGVYTDVHTGTELFERPGLAALREAVRAGDATVVVAYALDRLSRDQAHLGFLLSEWDHAGAQLELATETLDDTPLGRLIASVHGYAAAVEALKIKERTTRGKRARIASGKPPVGPRPPYGYRWVDDRDAEGKPVKLRLEASDTAWVVKRIFAEVAAGSSARQVARRLTEDGIPTPTGQTVWPLATITLLLRHPVYVGQLTANRWQETKVKGRGTVQTRRPACEQVVLPGVAPALVSPEVAAAAQARLATNQQLSVRNNHHPEAALLRGLGRCGYCGTTLQAVSTHWGTVYRCRGAARDRHGCPSFSIKADVLDPLIWDGVRTRLTDRDVIAAELERLRRDDPTHADTTTLERRLGELARRQRNLMARLADEDDADLAALIRADLAALREETRTLERERAGLEQQREGWAAAQQRLDQLDLWVRNVSTNLAEFDYAQRRLALTECQVAVTVWATDHAPRWQATMQLGGAAPIAFMTTCSAACFHNPIVLRWTDGDAAAPPPLTPAAVAA